MKAIEVKNLTKIYGKNIAVNDVSFSVEKGAICGILGPNGSGKTTTIKYVEYRVIKYISGKKSL